MSLAHFLARHSCPCTTFAALLWPPSCLLLDDRYKHVRSGCGLFLKMRRALLSSLALMCVCVCVCFFPFPYFFTCFQSLLPRNSAISTDVVRLFAFCLLLEETYVIRQPNEIATNTGQSTATSIHYFEHRSTSSNKQTVSHQCIITARYADCFVHLQWLCFGTVSMLEYFPSILVFRHNRKDSESKDSEDDATVQYTAMSSGTTSCGGI